MISRAQIETMANLAAELGEPDILACCNAALDGDPEALESAALYYAEFERQCGAMTQTLRTMPDQLSQVLIDSIDQQNAQTLSRFQADLQKAGILVFGTCEGCGRQFGAKVAVAKCPPCRGEPWDFDAEQLSKDILQKLATLRAKQ